MTKQEYEIRILEMYGKDFILVSENNEIKSRDQICIKCNKCNGTFEVNARTFIRKDRGLTICKNCEKIKKDKKKEIKEERSKNWYLSKEKVQKNIPSTLKVLNIQSTEKIEVLCNVCNNQYTASYTNLKKTKGCKFCNNRAKLTIGDYQRKLDEKYPGEYEVQNQIIKNYSYYKKNRPVIFHKTCGKITTKDMNEVLKYGCSFCGITSKNEYNDLVNKIRIITKQKYTLLTSEDEYKNMKTPVLMLHNKCGTKWNVTLDNFINGETRCPKCSGLSKISRQSKYIFSILNKKRIFFKKEARFKNIGRKRFDIIIKQNNLLIEIDGLQHFESIFKGNSFINTIKNDQLKNNFCKETKKNLVRIPYNFDLDKLEDLLSDLTLNNIHNFPNIFFIKDGKEFHKENYYAPVKNELLNLNLDPEDYFN